MDSMLRDYIQNTLSALDAYHVTDSKMLQEIAELRQKYMDFGEKCGDLGTFVTKAPECGIYEAFTSLASKIVMAQYQQQNASGNEWQQGNASGAQGQQAGANGTQAQQTNATQGQQAIATQGQQGNATQGQQGNATGTYGQQGNPNGIQGQQSRANSTQGQHSNAAGASIQANRPTVRQFLEQYRTAYNEVRKDPSRARGAKAYERLFAVADETEDLIEAQILMEERHLVWNLTAEDSLCIFENRLKDMDPLFRATTATLLNSIDAVKKSSSAEDLQYYSTKGEVKTLFDVQDYKTKMLVTVNLALRLTEYCNLKRDFYKTLLKVNKKKYIQALLEKRAHIVRICAFLETKLGLPYKFLLEDETSKIWFLSPSVADDQKSLGKVRDVSHPQNYEVFRDLLENEILADISLAECLKRKPEYVIYYRM